MSKRILQSLVVFALCIFSQQAFAVKDYVIERAYFEDKTGQLSFEEVKNSPHEPMSIMLSKGYSASVFWVRLKVEGSSDDEKSLNPKTNQLVVRIQPAYLDDIRLFDPFVKSDKERAVGDRHSINGDEYQSLNFNFLIPKSDQDRYIWLRVQTTSTNFMHSQIVSLEDCAHLDRIQEFVFSFYLAILCLLFLIPLFIWFVKKDLLISVFVIKQFAAITLLVFNAGYLRLLLKDINLDTLQFLVNINLIGYSFITIFFHYTFLNEYVLKRWVKFFFFFTMSAFPIEVLLLILQMDRFVLHMNMFVLNLMALSFLIIPAFGIDWRKSVNLVFSKWKLIFIHLLIFLCGVLTTLPSLGYFEGNEFSPVSGLAYGGITGIIFFLVLQYRYRLAREQSIARVSSAEAYANSERVRREQQGQFLAMLTHELKTPLSIMKMGSTSSNQSEKIKKHIQTAIQDMTDVIDRCVMDDKLQNHEFQLNLQECNLEDLIDEKISQYEDANRIQFEKVGSVMVRTDIQLLKICIGNLIDNALKYGREGGFIQISIVDRSHESGQVEISVKNELGVLGIPDTNKIFDKYYRDPKAYEKTGSGLGLYLVKNFVGLLSGDIQCHVRDSHITLSMHLPVNKL